MAFYPNWADEIVQDLENFVPRDVYASRFHMPNEEVLMVRLEQPTLGNYDFQEIIDFIEDEHPVFVQYKGRTNDISIGLTIYNDPDGLI